MSSGNAQVHDSWLHYLAPEFDADYMKALKGYLREQKRLKVIYPPGKEIFSIKYDPL